MAISTTTTRWILAGMLMIVGTAVTGVHAHDVWAYVGTYTRNKPSEGIYVFRFDAHTGKPGPPRLAVVSDNPSFLAIHPDGRHLYAANEVGDFGGQSSGAVTAYQVDPATGELVAINQQPTRGSAPCHLVVSPQGRHVLVANYSGGSVAALPLRDDAGLDPASSFHQHTGSSVDPRRQSGPHAHSINLDAAGRYAFAADLGLDKILVYRFDSQRGVLEPNEPAWAAVAPRAGPRHFAFHPSGAFAYVINEMNLTVTAFRYDADRGRLDQIQTISTLPEGTTGERLSTAEVRVHPSGRFLYGSNRGHNTIAIFAIDQQDGKLTAVGHEPTQGSTPRNFAIDPSGQFLFAENQQSDSIVLFRIDDETGKLTATGERIEVPSPVCIRFLNAAS